MPTKNQPRIQRNDTGQPQSRERSLRPRERATVGWDEVDNQQLRDAICAVTGAGAAIMLGRTSDGGALSITVLDGDQRVKEYPRDAEEATKTLSWVVSMFSDD